MCKIKVTDELIRALIIFGTVVATPLLMVGGIIAFPILCYICIKEWCEDNLFLEDN